MYDDKCVFVMPTRNTFLGKTLSTVDEVLKKLISRIRKNLTKEQEIIIIDDGSEDNTLTKITHALNQKKFKPEEPRGREFKESRCRIFTNPDLVLRILVMRFEEREGFNMAVVRGYQYALRRGAAFMIKLDSDGQHLPKDFPELLEHAKKYRECKRVVLSGKDADPRLSGGFGFRIIRLDEPARMKKILDSLEEFAINRRNEEGTERHRFYCVDVKTDELIENAFEGNVLCYAR